MNIDYAKLTEIADDAGIDEDNVRTDYSGRGMYGRTCVGFDLDSKGDLLNLGASLQANGLLDEFYSSASFDSMGLGIIVYFPGIKCEDGPKDEDEDEED